MKSLFKDNRIPKTCHLYSFEWGKMPQEDRLLNERANR